MEKEIFRVEDELDKVKEEYDALKSGKSVPLKELAK